jgi:tripartite-type tricarboxylate transporter receptor subunit TctC
MPFTIKIIATHAIFYWSAAVFAQQNTVPSTPQKPIKLIVPYAAGGPIDVTARLLAERVKDSLGTVIIDNRPGAGGNIGADAVAKAAPDGLTIGIAALATHAINPWLYRKMPYDAAKDFAAITQMVRVPNVLVMNADTAARLKINTLADLVQYAKANPGTSPTTAATRRNWRCCQAKWTLTLTTWPPPHPTFAQASSRRWP